MRAPRGGLRGSGGEAAGAVLGVRARPVRRGTQTPRFEAKGACVPGTRDGTGLRGKARGAAWPGSALRRSGGAERLADGHQMRGGGVTH